MSYRPDKFEKLYHTDNGADLWRFLQEHDSILQMETASYLGRPAVEPLSTRLKQRFGGDVTRNRVKQMIGHMVRQIMEARGFRLDQSGVKIRRQGNIFYSASRYIAPAK